MRNAHLDDPHSSQNTHVHLFSDADDDHVAVLYAGLRQCLLTEVFGHEGVFCVLAHVFDFILVLVENDDFLSGLRQSSCQGAAEAAQSDDSVCDILILFHDDYFLPIFIRLQWFLLSISHGVPSASSIRTAG